MLEEFVVVSLDEGSIKWVSGYVKCLGGVIVIIDKWWYSVFEMIYENIIGGLIEGCVVLMFDDMISIVGLICSVVELVYWFGVREIYVVVIYGVFVGKVVEWFVELFVD